MFPLSSYLFLLICLALDGLRMQHLCHLCSILVAHMHFSLSWQGVQYKRWSGCLALYNRSYKRLGKNKIKSEIYKCFPFWEIQLQTFLSLKCMKTINPKQNKIFNCVKYWESQSLWKMLPITVLCFITGYIFYEGFSIRKRRYFVLYLHMWKEAYVFS